MMHDVVIVSVSNPQQELYWQNRLEFLHSHVFCVTEDWPGGAGNGLGTLYAYQKARLKGVSKHGIDILELQRQGASVALYHTAGLGKRLAPLTLSEGNNKSAVKLPGYWHSHPLTILEAVIKQTSDYPLKGRLGVFWGDQIFLGSSLKAPSFDIELLTMASKMPTEKEWTERGLHHYGIVIHDAHNHVRHLDKVDYEFLMAMQPRQCSLNLGSFSLSAPFLSAMLEEYAPELSSKQSKLDTDPHFWMPMSLDKELYLQLMEKRGESMKIANQQYARMQKLRSFSFGTTNIGNASWYDFGTVQAYYRNNMKLLSDQSLRDFYGVEMKNGNILVNCSIKSGDISNSILIGVSGEHLEIKDSIVMHSSFHELRADGSLLYNVKDNGNLKLEKGTVRADVERLPFYSRLERDGKTDWDKVLEGNRLSYAESISRYQSNKK